MAMGFQDFVKILGFEKLPIKSPDGKLRILNDGKQEYI